MELISISAKRWFQRSYGNTYHSVVVHLAGREPLRSGKVYGYGDHYLQTACEMLNRAGILATHPLTMWARETGRELAISVADVQREKDL